jgi:hypothetical protein
MAPYDFKALDADVILRSSDGKEYHAHKAILSFSSPLFQDIFSLPQSTVSPPQIQTIDLTEPSETLEPFFQYIYPCSPPKISDITVWAAVYVVADKYQAEGVMDSLKDILLPKFLEASPFGVYALASRWGFEEEAKTASTRTLTLDILKDFTREDAELMGGAACHKLFLLHLNRREAVQAFIVKHRRPYTFSSTCVCSATPLVGFVPALCHLVGAKPSVTLEEVSEIVTNRWPWPATCGERCSFSHESKYNYCRSLARGISELPLFTG